MKENDGSSPFAKAPASPERHPKGWGEELWIANTPLYCGKKMLIRAGKRCSIHYHKLKDETFYVQSGIVELNVYENGYPGEPTRIVMKEGDMFHIPPLTPHQFIGIENCEFFEFSTQHFENDTYRHVVGD